MTLTLNKIHLNFILVLFIILLLDNHGVQSDDWEYSLVKNLLKGYDPSIRPSIHHNLTLNVTFGLSLAQIIDVVKKKQTYFLLSNKGLENYFKAFVLIT
jgi:hypothetical protein